jgi:sigma-B regulation protein RsbU (phosphoserine phosphatase)
MSQSVISSGFAAELALNVEPTAHPELLERPREQELELQLAEVRRDYADLHAALFEASQVYRKLCAPRLARHGSFEIASETFAARHVPGDFFTIKDNDESAILALGDISGKGLAAGMWTTLLLGLLGMHSESCVDPEVIVAETNRDLCRLPIGVPLASLFVGRLDSTTGRLDYCSAGHPPALLLRSEGSLESLSDGGPLLGVVANGSFSKGSAELREGDVLVIYSDGVLEAHNYSDEEFGLDRLESQLRNANGGDADTILFSMLGSVQDFVGGCPQADDMTLAVVRKRKPRTVS